MNDKSPEMLARKIECHYVEKQVLKGDYPLFAKLAKSTMTIAQMTEDGPTGIMVKVHRIPRDEESLYFPFRKGCYRIATITTTIDGEEISEHTLMNASHEVMNLILDRPGYFAAGGAEFLGNLSPNGGGPVMPRRGNKQRKRKSR